LAKTASTPGNRVHPRGTPKFPDGRRGKSPTSDIRSQCWYLVRWAAPEDFLSACTPHPAHHAGHTDWFRFWLQGYEDPDPAKRQQYVHWREMKAAVRGGREGADNQK
jgi:hypothetical protein